MEQVRIVPACDVGGEFRSESGVWALTAPDSPAQTNRLSFIEATYFSLEIRSTPLPMVELALPSSRRPMRPKAEGARSKKMLNSEALWSTRDKRAWSRRCRNASRQGLPGPTSAADTSSREPAFGETLPCPSARAISNRASNRTRVPRPSFGGRRHAPVNLARWASKLARE